MDIVNKLTRQFKAELTGRIIATISSSALTVLLARLLEPNRYGLLFLTISIFGIIKLFSKLGIGRSAARYLSEYSESDTGQIPHILKTSFILNISTIFITGTLLVIASERIAVLVGESELSRYLPLGALFIGFGSIVSYLRITLQGFGEIKTSSVIYAADRFCRLFLAVSFVLLGYGVVGALGGYILSAALVSISGLSFLYLSFYRTIKQNTIEPNLRRRIVEYAIPLTATNTANILDKRVDTILIGFFLNPLAVAYYTAGKQVVQFLKMPVTSLGFTLSPVYGSRKASGDSDTAARIYERSLSYGLLLYIPIGFGLLAIAEPLVKLVFGGNYTGAVPVLHVFSFYIVFQSITELTNTSLDYLGRAKARAIVQVTTSLLNVFLNVILIPRIGIVGAAIATVITHFLYTVANVYVIHLELDLRIRLLLRYVVYSVILAIIISAPVYGIIRVFPGLIPMLVAVLLGVLIWTTLIEVSGLIDVREAISSLF
ncbi:flippase [Natrinema salaciae]|uniref:Membrane protein involved in the export of O-antigen and teichoic acid n=1 Tax=Natrinema salaciae TaxID=1186196 RepID=A0A1H9BY91_9EURY|nr:flippase [Natrinema salaciae]SEP93717.1 Membrane protein involved in the export of O-antigen and teichoic acid [Natrinema salaciae]